MLELALVVAHGLDRLRVGAGERLGDLLGRQLVVARHRLGALHVAQLLEHGRPVFVGALVGLDRRELDLGELREPSLTSFPSSWS